MPPKGPRKPKEPVDPATLRRSTRGSAPENEPLPLLTSSLSQNLPPAHTQSSSSKDSSKSIVVDPVFEDNPASTSSSPTPSTSTLQPGLGDKTLTEFEGLLTAGSPKPPAQPFSITEALKKFIGTASHPPSTSPSVVSIQDTDTNSTSPHTGYISSDDDPDADDAEFIPASASTGFLPIQFNQATFDVNDDDSEHIPSDTSTTTDTTVESIHRSEVDDLQADKSDSSIMSEGNPLTIPPIAPADPMAVCMAMIAQMTAQREADQKRYEQEKQDAKKREERQEQWRLEEAAQRRDDERQRKADYDAKFDELQRQLLESRKRPTTQAPRSGAKVPTFNLDTDKAIFFCWKEKWEAYIISHSLNLIEDEDEKRIRIRAELTTAMSDHTIRWFGNQGFSNAQKEDPEFLIYALEQYIRGTTNPLVQNVELLSLKKSADESVEHFVERIKEKAKLCELDNIEDASDYFPMLCLIAGHNSADTRKKLMLEKVKTFAKAVEICLAEEKATKTSRQFASGSGSFADMAATSTYKKEKRDYSQASQSNSSRGRGYKQDFHGRGRGSQDLRGGRGSQDQHRGRGDHREGRGKFWDNGEHSQPPSHNRSNDRSRSISRNQSTDCYRCGKPNHYANNSECKAINAKCRYCDKIGHYDTVCKSKAREDRNRGESSTISSEANLIQAQAHFPSSLGLGSIHTTPRPSRSLSRSAEPQSNSPELTLSAIELSTIFSAAVPNPEALELVEVQLTDPEGHTIEIKALPDTGANISAIPAASIKRKVTPTSQTLRSADGTLLNTYGTIKFLISLRGESTLENFHIVDGLTRPILSRRVITDLKLIHPDFPHTSINALEKSKDGVPPLSHSISPANSFPTLSVQAANQSANLTAPGLSNPTKIITKHGPAFDELLNEFPELFTGKCTVMKDGNYKID